MLLKKSTYKNLAMALAIATLLSACQGGSKPASEQPKSDTLNESAISKDVQEVVYPMPTPFELAKMLKDIQATYIKKALNDPSKVDKYFTEKSKAVNLGIYGADLAYAATYDQKQDIKVYSKALKTLIDQLGIAVDFSTLLSEDNKEKLNNKDTLTKVITNTFFDTYKYLQQKSNPDLAIMMVTGMWVEAMYIATNISEDTYHYSGWAQLIANQNESYAKLMALLESKNADKDIKDLEDKLAVLKSVYDKVKSGLTEQDYLKILNTIKEVRKSIVG